MSTLIFILSFISSCEGAESTALWLMLVAIYIKLPNPKKANHD